jgi:hypothetical protein
MRATIALVVLANVLNAQDSYRVPFAAQGNTIELTIANTSPIAASQVSVETTDLPSWVKFSQTSVTINQLNAKEEKPALFSFSVDKLVEVGKDQTLSFVVRASTGQSWTKEIKILRGLDNARKRLK